MKETKYKGDGTDTLPTQEKEKLVDKGLPTSETDRKECVAVIENASEQSGGGVDADQDVLKVFLMHIKEYSTQKPL